MELNKIKKKTALQIMLFIIGSLLIFLIYFNQPNKNKSQKITNDTSIAEDVSQEKDGINTFEGLEYKGIDNNGNRFVIFSENSSFEIEKPEIIYMKNIICYFYFKDQTVLEIRSDKGVYNNITLDMGFSENVNMFYKESSLYSNKAEFNNSKNSLTVEGNVKTDSPSGNLVADVVNFDFIDKKLKVSMYNEDKVNIKTKFK